MLRAAEVERSLAASWRLMRHETDSLSEFDRSIEGYWRSFLALALILPAFVVHMAGDWHMMRAAGILEGVELARFLSTQSAGLLVVWLGWPLAALGLVRLLGVEGRYLAYVTAYNWSSVLAAAILAAPMALYLMGWALPSHAFVFTLAFGAIVIHFRWFLARCTLGVSSGVAAIIATADVALTLAVVQATALALSAG